MPEMCKKIVGFHNMVHLNRDNYTSTSDQKQMSNTVGQEPVLNVSSKTKNNLNPI